MKKMHKQTKRYIDSYNKWGYKIASSFQIANQYREIAINFKKNFVD